MKVQTGEGERYLGNSKYKPEGQVTLYAIWESTVVTINFNSNDEMSRTVPVEVEKGKDTKLPKNTFEREGYDFVEWGIHSDGSGTKYQEGNEINITEDMTLYAIWKKRPKTDGSWNEEAQVNNPKLMNGMQALYWNAGGEEVINDPGSSWYEYVAGDNQTDTKTSKWANAKTSDGSYWVWIPRYEYKIVTGKGTSTAGQINVKFIPTTKTTADEGYQIHPAFTNGTSNKFKNGEWDSELSGIWVAKYEASHSDATADTAGSSTTMKIVPGVQSWRNITIGDSYTTSYNYDRGKESHLIKNSEWGAVAYLTHSQYGRNGHEIDINNSSTYITGNGGGSTNASKATGVMYAYNSETGAKASTTGNIYGIYDLSGGAWERVAAYITNGNANLSNGSSFVAKTEAEVEAEGYKTLSTKYATVYPYDSSNDGNSNNYNVYKNAGYGYGDAVLETSTSGSDTTSWFTDYFSFPDTGCPFFQRGGDCSGGAGAGVFSFGRTVGSNGGSSCSFRPVLAF